MKANRWTWAFLLLLLNGFNQQSSIATATDSAGTNQADSRISDRKLFEEIKAKAEKGDAQSQFELGAVFASGRLGVAKDDVEAVKWYRKAAEQGYAIAQRSLGNCYADGRGVPKDEVEEVKWYRKAADQGDKFDQWLLGMYYYNGKGVQQDYAEAVKWFRKAAEQGYAIAQRTLGFCYAIGKGVRQDYAEGVKWYRKAADQGLDAAQYFLGDCYANGRGVQQDYAEAVKWIRKAAEQNYAEAQVFLAGCYANGQGVATNQVEAVKWFRKAAEQNDATAQFNLGQCYANGRGVAKDDVEAVKWYRKAAEQGYDLARTYLTRAKADETYARRSNGPTEIITLDGRTYNSVRSLKATTGGLEVEYTPPGGGIGVVKIKFENLPADLQQKYGSDIENATAYEAEQAQGQAMVAAKIWADYHDAAYTKAVFLAWQEAEAQAEAERRIEKEKEAERVRIAKEKAEEDRRQREALREDIYEMSWQATRKAQEDQQRARDIWRETHPDYVP